MYYTMYSTTYYTQLFLNCMMNCSINDNTSRIFVQVNWLHLVSNQIIPNINLRINLRFNLRKIVVKDWKPALLLCLTLSLNEIFEKVSNI